MLKHVTLLGSAALAMAVATSAAAQDDITRDTVVAKVGDTEITVGQLLVARVQLPQQYSQFPNDALFQGLIDQLVQQQLLADTLDTVPADIEVILKNERLSLMANKAVEAIIADAVTEEAIQAAYDARFADLADVNEFNASHLLVETEEEAQAARARIADGAAFADVARDVSTGPTGPNGGNLGWFGPGAMVPAFEDVIMSLDVGEVSEPFETQFGWHVATVNEVRVQAKPTLDDVRRELVSELQQDAVNARIEELAAAQEVVKPTPEEFDPNIIDRLDLLE